MKETATTPDTSDVPNPLNNDLLIINVMKSLKLKKPLVKSCVLKCVEGIVQDKLLEEIGRERLALKNLFADILEEHSLSLLAQGKSDTMGRNLDIEAFIDEV